MILAAMGWMRCSVMTDPAMSDLFALDCFNRLIDKAGQAYDTVIIDTTPILLAPTARIVAKQADATLLVVRSDRTCVCGGHAPLIWAVPDA